MARRREVVGFDSARASADACALALRLAPLSRVQHLLLYAPRRGELDPSGIALARGRGVPTYYPRVHGDRLCFHRASRDDLTPGSYGIGEPAARAPELPPDATDVLVVVPGLAFDRCGGRLGSGKGYYDRALAGLSTAVRVGFVLDAFLLEALPLDAWDVPMHAVVTDRHLVVVDHRVADVNSGEPSWT